MRDAHHLDNAEELANILISYPNEVEILMKRWVGKQTGFNCCSIKSR